MKSSGVTQTAVRTWSVGELAERFRLETHVLRYWEEVGLLAPARDGAGRRRYAEDDVVRVATILSSKVAGMSLEQIQVLLDAGGHETGSAARHRVLTAHLAELDRRQAEIDRSRHMTEHAMSCRAHDIATCPHFREHVQDILDGTNDWNFLDDARQGGTPPAGRSVDKARA